MADPTGCKYCGTRGDHYCPNDLCENDERMHQCDNCLKWFNYKEINDEFLCKTCADLLQPETDLGDAYGFSKDI